MTLTPKGQINRAGTVSFGGPMIQDNTPDFHHQQAELARQYRLQRPPPAPQPPPSPPPAPATK